jgi:RNA recognition motif-containing protein
MAALAQDPVCAEPKLFVGGLRFEVTREEVTAFFSAFGPLKNAVLLTHKDSGRPKGCAMVLFTKWAHAETAQLSVNGVTNELSTPRAMTVKSADPQK